jgi:hypothetical protein
MIRPLTAAAFAAAACLPLAAKPLFLKQPRPRA